MSSALPLFELIHGADARAAAAATAITQAGEWDWTLQLAQAWRVLPQLGQRLRQLGVALPVALAQRLAAAATESAMRSGYAARRAGALAQQLAAAGIPAAAFKGIAALAYLHRSPAERMLGDIDLLIREQDLAAIVAALAAIGFLPTVGSAAADAVQSHISARQDNHGATLADGEGLEVDLHWRLRGGAQQLLEGALWQRVAPQPLLRQPVPMVAPIDALLLSTHHALRNDLSPFPTVRDLSDLHGYWRRVGCDYSVAELASLASLTGLAAPLLGLLQALEAVAAIPAADPALAQLREQCGRRVVVEGDRLYDWFRGRLERPVRTGYGVQDLLLLLADPPAVGRLLRDRLRERLRAGPTSQRQRREAVLGSDGNRLRAIAAVALGMDLRQWRRAWAVARAQRRAFKGGGDR